MAAVLDKKAPPPASLVEEQVAQAISRIRAHDLALGGLVLAALVLGYAAAMVLLDKYLVLPEWVRQLSLIGFAAVFLGSAYWTLARPLRRRINPLYAAVQVEKTIEDAKNSVAGYVEARDREDVHPTVRAAMGAKAAAVAVEADVNRAVDHRSLVWAGSIVIAFLLTLVVLFFVLRLNQFSSLVGRAFVPFSSDLIATRTRLELTRPEPPDATFTKGQTIVIAVALQGRLPDPNGPDRVRLLIRHNPASPNFEEVPMEPAQRAGAGGEWEAKVPDYLHLNGFYYQVAAGDARTPEHKITVRTAPTITDDFEVTYDYPPYRRLKPETVLRDPKVKAMVGTRVTVTAKTNREVEFARGDRTEAPNRLVLKPSNRIYVGQPVPGRPDSIKFVIPALPADATAYQMFFTAKGGERFADSPAYPVTVDRDADPIVVITAPEEDTVEEPANGQLKVDGTVGDDYGIDTVTLRMRQPGEKEPFFSKPYMGGKLFVRETDKTWPTSVTYKDSLDLTKLTDKDGNPVKLEPGTEVEFWLEAADNHAEFDDKDPNAPAVPRPNIGRSAFKKLIVGEPVTKPEEKKQQEQQKNDRKQDEQKHDQAQQQKLDKEQRPPPPQPNQQPNQPNQGEQPKKPEDQQGNIGQRQPMPGGMNDQQPKNDNNPPPMQNQGGMGGTQPNMSEQPGMPPPMGEPNNMGQQGDNPPNPMQVDQQANNLQKELDKRNQGGGEGRNNPAPNPQDRQDPAQDKGNPMGNPPPDASQQKEGPKPSDPMNMQNGGNPASERKDQGNVQQSQPSEPKPGPQDAGNPMNQQTGGMNGASEPKPEPLGGAPATDKETPKPKDGQKQPTDPMGNAGQQDKNDERNSAGGGKGAQQQPKQPPAGMDPMTGNPEQQPGEPQANRDPGQAKPMPTQERGSERPQPQEQNAGNQGGTPQAKTEPKPDAGDGKPQTAPPAADNKGAPQNPMANDAPKPGEPKPGPQDGMNKAAASEPKQPPKAEPMGGGTANNSPAEDRGVPDPKNNNHANAGRPQPKQPDKKDPNQKNGGGGQLTPEQKQEIENAAKDLNNPDPNKRKAAEEKLDKMVDKQAREEAQQLAKDLNSPDQKTREAAKQKFEEMAKQAGQKQPQDQNATGPKVDPKDANQAAKDLASNDKEKQEKAKQDLDRAVGEQNRKDLEKQAEAAKEDLKSGDPKRMADGQKKLDELGNKAEQMAKDNPENNPQQPMGRELSKEDVEALAKKAADLNSPDEAKRKAAELEFDDKIGKENREKLQEAMKKQQPGMNPEQQAEQAKKKLEEMKNAVSGGPDVEGHRRPSRPGTPQENLKGPMKDDPRNRLKSAQLQLEEFKKLREDDAIWKQAGIETPEERDRFFEGQKRRIAQLEKEVEAADRRAENPETPTGPPSLNVTGQGTVTERSNTLSGADAKAGGTVVAPPGFEGAKTRYQQGATKVAPPMK
jgi:hypothetical protein